MSTYKTEFQVEEETRPTGPTAAGLLQEAAKANWLLVGTFQASFLNMIGFNDMKIYEV